MKNRVRSPKNTGRLLTCAALVFSVLTFAAHAAGERYALLVGVTEYREDSGLTNLKYPENDMTKLKDALVELGFSPENIRLMIQSGGGSDRLKPRKDNIVKELQLLMKNKRAEDLVVVMFAGHGLQFRGDTKVFFCPSDARIEGKENLLDISSVFETLKDCEAGSKLLIADSCRDDPLFKGTRGGVSSLTKPQHIKPPQSVGVLYSCGEGESAYEDDKELKGGVFTHFLIKGLKGEAEQNGEISAASLADYVQRKVYDFVNAKRGASQTPSFMVTSGRTMVLGKLGQGSTLVFTTKMKAGKTALDAKDYRKAVDLYEEAHKLKPFDAEATKQLAESMFELGVSLNTYFGGKDDKEAAEWYAKAAEMGSSPAQCNLGWMYTEGIGVQKNSLEGLRWYKLAVEQNNSQAMTNLGMIYDAGLIVPQNYKEAVRLESSAANDGNIEAMRNLGYLYNVGHGVNKSDEESFKWYKQAADKGDMYSVNCIGWAYEYGLGVQKNYGEAMRLYRAAADKGNASAQCNLGHMFDLAKNYPEAQRWYRLAAEQGEMVAANNLGVMYQNGTGVQQSTDEAIKWYKVSAEKGYGLAASNLGHIYNGASNYPEAIRWFRMAANQGDAACANELGWLYQNTYNNLNEAVKWYTVAANKGDARGQTNLGYCYENGLGGLPQNLNIAIQWYQKAARQGFATAQQNCRTFHVSW
ncbi:MAG TPA: caspase family protein [Planctomycetota bacterium]|nr:caspase family protein [Planctomycetota bacterium]